MYVNYEIIIKEIEEPEKPGIVYETEDLIIRSVPLNHSKVCVGYVLEEKDRPGVFFPDKAKEAGVPCGPLWSQLQNGQSVQLEDGRTVDSTQVMGQMRKGRKFSFVTDTAYVPSLPKEVEGSDLFICEGMFDLSLSASAREKKHLTSHQAATIAEKAGNIKKMGLIHYSPRYTERELRNLLKEAREVFPDTFLCRDRMKLEIPYEE
jgi:ribonuclease Z